MGIFSSKEEHHVDTSVARMIPNDQLPDARKRLAIEALLGDTDLFEDFQSYAINGGFRNFERMYNYAKAGKYLYGLPNTKLLSSTSAKDSIQVAIESEKGYPVVLTYAHYLPANNVHIGWQTCYEQYGYNRQTNELKVLSQQIGHPVYLDNLVAHHRIVEGAEPEVGSLQLFDGCDNPMAGYTPERPANNELSHLVTDDLWLEGSDLTEAVEIRYVWEDTTGDLHRDSILIDLSGFDPDLEYYQARYTYKVDNQTRIGYWHYKAGDGIHPDLDSHYDLTRSSPGTYFPFVLFYQYNESLTEPTKRAGLAYRSTQSLLNKVGLDYQLVADSLEKSDLQDAEQVAMIMGVPMNSEDPVELRYLHSFFQQVYLQVRDSTPTKDKQYSLSISDSDFRFNVSFRGITSRLKTGSVTSVGEVYRSDESLDTILAPEDATTELTLDRVSRGRQKKYYFHLQVSETVVQEICIDDPRFRYDIYRGEGVGGGADNDKMLIPLDYELCQKLSFLDREYLYHRSLHIIVNTRVTTKTKFYQTKAFGYLIMVVSIVMAIPSGGQSLNWAKIVASFTTVEGIKALVWKMFIKKLIMDLTFRVLVKIVGPENAMMLALMAVAAGIANKAGLFGIEKGTTADMLLGMTTGLIEPANKEMAKLHSALMNDMVAFQQEVAEKTELLDEANDLLTPQNLLSPTSFVGPQPLMIFGESPDELYARTVESENPGVASFEILEKFVEHSLKLPEMRTI